MPNLPRMSKAHEDVLQTTAGVNVVAAGGVVYSKPYFRVDSATLVTFLIRGTAAGTLDVQGLRAGGDASVDADWYVYNTTGEVTTINANEYARMTVFGGPPIMRARYTPTGGGTMNRAEAWSMGFSS